MSTVFTGNDPAIVMRVRLVDYLIEHGCTDQQKQFAVFERIYFGELRAVVVRTPAASPVGAGLSAVLRAVLRDTGEQFVSAMSQPKVKASLELAIMGRPVDWALLDMVFVCVPITTDRKRVASTKAQRNGVGKLRTPQLKRLIGDGKPVAKSDGGGLTFTLSGAGTAAWVLRYRIGGRRKELTIGNYPDIGLAEARKIARTHRAAIKVGRDPAAEKQMRARRPAFPAGAR